MNKVLTMLYPGLVMGVTPDQPGDCFFASAAIMTNRTVRQLKQAIFEQLDSWIHDPAVLLSLGFDERAIRRRMYQLRNPAGRALRSDPYGGGFGGTIDAHALARIENVAVLFVARASVTVHLPDSGVRFLTQKTAKLYAQYKCIILIHTPGHYNPTSPFDARPLMGKLNCDMNRKKRKITIELVPEA